MLPLPSNKVADLQFAAEIEIKESDSPLADIVIESKPHFAIAGKEKISKALKACYEQYEEHDYEIIGDTPIAMCVEEILEAKTFYPKKFEFKFKYVGHLTSIEGFIASHKRVQILKDADEKLILKDLNEKDITALGEWEQLHYLLVHLYFLIDLYIQVKREIKSPPAFFKQGVALDRLEREIQLTANAFRFRVAYFLISSSKLNEVEKKIEIAKGIKTFLQSLDENWHDLNDGDVAVLPIGGTGHAFYLVLVKNKHLNGEDTKKSFVHFRVDNFLKADQYHCGDGGGKVFPRILMSLEAGALIQYDGNVATQMPDLISYLTSVCMAKSLPNSLACEFIYPEKNIAKARFNLNIFPKTEVKQYNQFYFSFPEQDIANCVVYNFNGGIQYRLQSRANFYVWFNKLEIAACFKDWRIMSQMSPAEKWKQLDLDYEDHIDSVNILFRSALEKKYLANKFIKSAFVGEDNFVESNIKTGFTNLFLKIKQKQNVDDVKKTVTLDLTQLFEANAEEKTPPKKIHIFGESGSGKTVLNQYLSMGWASDFVLEGQEAPSAFLALSTYLRKKFDALICIQLKNLLIEQVDLYQYILKQFFINCPVADRPSSEVLEKYIDINKNRILFLIDGLSSFESNISGPEQTLLQQIFAKGSYIVVTSRSPTLASYPFDLELENLGFTDESVEICIKKLTANNLPEMKEIDIADKNPRIFINYLKSNPRVWHLAHNPFYLELIFRLWLSNYVDLKNSEAISTSYLFQWFVKKISNVTEPRTQYEVSEALGVIISPLPTVADLLQQFLEALAFRHSGENSLLIIPETIDQILKKLLEKEGCKGQRFVKYHIPILIAAASPGSFLRKITLDRKSHSLDKTVYAFSSLSFQEYFAASHILSVLNDDEESEKVLVYLNITKNKYNPKFLRIWILAAGLLYQHGKKINNFSALKNFWERGLLAGATDLIGLQHMQLIAFCLNECEASCSLPFLQHAMDQIVHWYWWLVNGVKKPVEEQAQLEYFTNVLKSCEALKSSTIFVNELLKGFFIPKELLLRAISLMGGTFEYPTIEFIDALINFIKVKQVPGISGCAAWILSMMKKNLPNVSAAKIGVILRDPSINLDTESQRYLEEIVNQPKPKKLRVDDALPGIDGTSLDLILTEADAWQKEEKIKNFILLSMNSDEEIKRIIEIAISEKNWSLQKTISTSLAMTKYYISIVEKLLLQVNSSVALNPEFKLFIIGLLRECQSIKNPSLLLITTLANIIEKNDKELSQACIEIWSKFCDLSSEVITFFNSCCTSANNYLRLASISLLRKIHPDKVFVLSMLIKALNDNFFTIREQAIMDLYHLKNFSNAEYVDKILLKFIDPKLESNENVRSAALHSLLQADENLNEPAVHLNVAIDLLEEKNEANFIDKFLIFKYVVNRNLTPASRKTVGDVLSKILDSNKKTFKKEAAIALCKLMFTYVPAINYLLVTLNPGSNFEEIHALIKLCNSEAKATECILDTFRQDKALRLAAAKILGCLENPERVKQVLTAIAFMEQADLFFIHYLNAQNLICLNSTNDCATIVIRSSATFFEIDLNREVCVKINNILEKLRINAAIDDFYQSIPSFSLSPIQSALSNFGLHSSSSSIQDQRCASSGFTYFP